MTGGFGERLTKSRIEQKPKSVRAWEQFFDRVGLADHPAWQDDLDDLIDAIGNGQSVPQRYYRKSRGRDWLLEKHGIMHLHLESPGSDVIVYLVQFEDEVLLLGVGSHAELARDAVRTWRARGAFSTSADKRAEAKRRGKMAAAAAQSTEKQKAIAASISKLRASKATRVIGPGIMRRKRPAPPTSKPSDDD